MCSDLLLNKYFWLVLLIYWVPSFVLLGYAFSAVPSQGEYGDEPTSDYVPMLEIIFAILALLLLFIPGPLILACIYPYIMIPYFMIAYGSLILYYRREQTKKSGRRREEGLKEALEQHTYKLT
jgi:hypothetical protein